MCECLSYKKTTYQYRYDNVLIGRRHVILKQFFNLEFLSIKYGYNRLNIVQ